jgi:hypothetical protein
MKLRLEHLDGVAVRVGAGLEDLEAFARSHPDAPTSTFFTAGSVVDGFVVVAGPRTLLVCTFPTDRPMSPAAT